MEKATPAYQIGARWKIVKANDAFCRALHCTESSLLGRDVRELLREDWRDTFRTYVAQALTGVGDLDATLPLVAPCGQHGWFTHEIEPLLEGGRLSGYRATVEPRITAKAGAPRRWWQWRAVTPHQVWDFNADQLRSAG